MENAKGYVTLAIGGKSVKLRYDHNALADAEEILGKPIHELFPSKNDDPEDAAKIGFNEIRVLLYVGSQGAFRSKRDAGSVITMGNIQEVTQAIVAAIAAAFPDREEDQEGEA